MDKFFSNASAFKSYANCIRCLAKLSGGGGGGVGGGVGGGGGGSVRGSVSVPEKDTRISGQWVGGGLPGNVAPGSEL